MIEIFKIVHNYYDPGAVVKLNFHPFSATIEAIDLNYKNLIVTTTLENIHLVPEL